MRAAVYGGLDDDGLIQRFQLIVWPDVSRTFRNVDQWPDTKAKRQVSDIVQRLNTLDVGGSTVDEYDNSKTPFVRFNEQAQCQFDSWRERLELRLRSGDEHPAMESHLGKFRSLIPSLALILHLTECQTGPVESRALTLAIRWGEYLESHARRVYAAAISAETAAAKAIWRRICRGDLTDGFDARTVYRHGWTGLTDTETVKEGLCLLADHGYIVVQEKSA